LIALALAVVACLLAGCVFGGLDGTSSASAPVSSPSGGGSIDRPTTTPGPNSHDGPGASPSYDPALAQRACDLVTVAAVEAATGVTGLAPRPESGDADTGTCAYRAGDRIVAWVSRSEAGADAEFAAADAAGDTTVVPGVGDGAIWSRNPGILLIRVGEGTVGIQFAPTIVPETEIIARATAVGLAALAALGQP